MTSIAEKLVLQVTCSWVSRKAVLLAGKAGAESTRIGGTVSKGLGERGWMPSSLSRGGSRL